MQFGRISFTPQRKLVHYGGFALPDGTQSGTQAKRSLALLAGVGENVLAVNGVLRRGLGLLPAHMPVTTSKQVGISGFVKPQYVFCVKNGKVDSYSYHEGLLGIDVYNDVYFYNPNSSAWVSTGVKCSEARVHTFVDNEGTITALLCGSTGIYSCNVSTLSLTKVSSEGMYRSCVCQNRLFYQSAPYTLSYSAPVEVSFAESIDDGGMLTLPSQKGYIMDMLAVGSYVYVFLERGVARLRVSGTARDFVLEELGYDGGEIFIGSPCACAENGEKIFFLATDGVYCICGDSVKKVRGALPTKRSSIGYRCVGAAVEGYYALRFVDENGEQRTWVYDVASGEGYFSFDLSGLSATVNGATYCVQNSKVWKLSARGGLPVGVDAAFTAQTDFNTLDAKTWESVELYGEGRVHFTVQTPTRERTFVAVLEEGVAQIPVRLRAEKFRVRITLDEGATLRGLTARVRGAKRSQK